MKKSNSFGLQLEKENKVSFEELQDQLIEMFGHTSVETSLDFSNEWN